MNINLFKCNTTFGAAYSNPPERFTTGKVFGYQLSVCHDLVNVFPLPAKKAYFATEHLSQCVWYERAISTAPILQKRDHNITTNLIVVNPKVRFMSAAVFGNGKQIPLKSLADRNIAVVGSDIQYHSLGDVGREKRRQSFYHSDNTPIHSDLSDKCIDELAMSGLFSVEKNILTNIMSITHPVTSVNHGINLELKDAFFELAELIREPSKYRQGVRDAQLMYPIIDIDNVPQPAHVSTILSPRNDHFMMLVRQSDMKLPMLQGGEAIEAKYQAFIDQAAHSPGCIENSEFAKMLREAEFFQAPYKTATEFCELSIRELRSYKEGNELTSSPIINNAIDRLAFSKKYMLGIADLIKKAMLYDDLLLIKQSDDFRADLINKQKENSTQIMEQELCFIGQSVNLGFLSGSGKSFSVPLLYLYSLIYTSLSDVLMVEQAQGMEKQFLDKMVVLKKQAEDICIELDEVLSSKETLCSLRQKHTFVSMSHIERAGSGAVDDPDS